MDFKAALQAEIEAKKKQLSRVKSGTGGSSVKVADLERERQEEYLEKQRILEESRQLKLDSKLAKINEKVLTETEVTEAASTEDNDKDKDNVSSSSSSVIIVPPEINREIEKKLKLLNHPIRLFGESDRQRMARLKLYEERAEELDGGQRNDFRELLGRQQDDEGNEDRTEEDSKDRNKRSKSDTTTSDISISDIKINRTLLSTDRSKCRDLLSVFFKVLLKKWEENLDSRPEDVKRSQAGRMVTATQQQAIDYMRPFFRLLERDELPADILIHLVEIVGYLQEREYVRANDTYLRLSIGNAPWPIGVTMVGIHERSAHEKINSGTVAHALNDEVTRKWIQSIKRLMTFCQKLYPPTDASKAMG